MSGSLFQNQVWKPASTFCKVETWQGAHSRRNSGGRTRGAAWLARERRCWLPDGFFARDRHRIQAGGVAAPGSGRLGPRGRSPGHVTESPGGRKSHRAGRPRATVLSLAGRAGPGRTQLAPSPPRTVGSVAGVISHGGHARSPRRRTNTNGPARGSDLTQRRASFPSRPTRPPPARSQPPCPRRHPPHACHWLRRVPSSPASLFLLAPDAASLKPIRRRSTSG